MDRTIILSAMFMISLSSEDTTSIVRPWSANWWMMSKTSVLAPMSMPREGSSMSRIFGSVSRPLPMTTFCWLPPESESMGSFLSATLMCISSITLSTSSSSAFWLRRRPMMHSMSSLRPAPSRP